MPKGLGDCLLERLPEIYDPNKVGKHSFVDDLL